ncbi:MAG: asparagine synthase-related protein, partial [Calditrichota bacterium]
NSADYFLGLSGGYDSRLLAQAVKDFSPRCLNFGYPDSTETKLAAEVAEFLNAGFTTESFPEDLIACHGASIADKQRIMFTLEYAHVSHLQQRVREAKTDFFLDGFVGDVVLGSGYFYKKGGSVKDLLNYLFLTMNINEPARENTFYQEMLYNDPEAISDAELSGLMTGGIRAEIMKRIRRTLETVRDSAEMHFDIVEAVRHYTRGRNLIAGGPVGIGNYARAACLFVDSRVRAVCMNTNKKLRIGNGLYNYYWRTYLPELSHFRKAGSTGSPSDSAWLYRTKDVAAAVGRRVVNPLAEKLFGASPQVEQAYFSNEKYLSNEANRNYIEETIDAPDRHLPLVISEKLREHYEKKCLSPSLLLRFVTLNSYLGEGENR